MSKQEYWYSSWGLPKICTLAGCMLMAEGREGEGGRRSRVSVSVLASGCQHRSLDHRRHDTLDTKPTFPFLVRPFLDVPVPTLATAEQRISKWYRSTADFRFGAASISKNRRLDDETSYGEHCTLWNSWEKVNEVEGVKVTTHLVVVRRRRVHRGLDSFRFVGEFVEVSVRFLSFFVLKSRFCAWSPGKIVVDAEGILM